MCMRPLIDCYRLFTPTEAYRQTQIHPKFAQLLTREHTFSFLALSRSNHSHHRSKDKRNFFHNRNIIVACFFTRITWQNYLCRWKFNGNDSEYSLYSHNMRCLNFQWFFLSNCSSSPSSLKIKFAYSNWSDMRRVHFSSELSNNFMHTHTQQRHLHRIEYTRAHWMIPIHIRVFTRWRQTTRRFPIQCILIHQSINYCDRCYVSVSTLMCVEAETTSTLIHTTHTTYTAISLPIRWFWRFRTQLKNIEILFFCRICFIELKWHSLRFDCEERDTDYHLSSKSLNFWIVVRINFILTCSNSSIVNCSNKFTHTPACIDSMLGRCVNFTRKRFTAYSPRHCHLAHTHPTKYRTVQSAPKTHIHTHAHTVLSSAHRMSLVSSSSRTHLLTRLIHSGRKYKMRYRKTANTQSFLTRQCVQTRNHIRS